MIYRLALSASLLFALPAAAQTEPAQADSRQTSPTATPCAYAQCALRIEPGFFGQRLMQGRDGATISREGIFGFDLERVVLDAPLAVDHAREYAGARRRSLLSIVGAGVLVSSLGSLNTTDEGRAGLGLASLGLVVYGTVEAVRSQRESARAIWEYNATLDR